MNQAWAKIPSQWAKVKNRVILDAPQEDGMDYLPSESETAIPHPSGEGFLPGLSYLRWGVHKGSGTAAIMLLFALSILSNLGQIRHGRRTDNWVVASYDELESMTLLSREMVAKGLKLLRELGAVTSRRVGNRCAYELVGIDTDGAWCALPQDHLMQGTETLRRLAGMRETIKRRTSLDAMKLYMLLLAFRVNTSNVARVGYDLIRQYTGLRREQISMAVQLLIGAGLCRLAADEELPLVKGQRRHNRYVLLGLRGQRQ